MNNVHRSNFLTGIYPNELQIEESTYILNSDSYINL